MEMARSGLLLLLLFLLVLPPDPFQSLLVSGLKEEQDVGERGMMKREEASEERFGGEVVAKRYASAGGGHKAGGAPGAMNHRTNSPHSGSNTCNTIIHFGLTCLGFALLASLLLPYILCSL
ncbi:uncharacterized protein LOC117916623 [Vitis riparia]|uniref:uncharacterized protein LOC117916623 n=1 Tax=Vitis riparia TaxID=96939 RepID=UPI00155ADCD2|nr:uncharacterized protein LOC117916623 [Vitis riparia]